MRILCCVNRDLASSVAVNLLLPTFAAHHVRIGLTEQVGGPPSSATEAAERRDLRVAEQTLPNEVFFPLIERAGFPDSGDRYLTFAEIERHRGISVAPFGNPNTPDALEAVREFAPDLILTIRYGAILKSAVISIPRFGVLNLHSGRLPQYRGMLATFRALCAGDAQIGCTLHKITDGTIDTGAVIETTRMLVSPGHSLLWHILELYPAGAKIVADALSRLSQGTPLPVLPGTGAEGAYYSHPSVADWEKFRQLGWVSVQAGDLAGIFRKYLP